MHNPNRRFSLADPNTFVMGFTPGAQVDRVIAYAHVLVTDRYPPFSLAP